MNNFVKFARVSSKQLFESKLNNEFSAYKTNTIVFISDPVCIYCNGTYYGTGGNTELVMPVTYSALKNMKNNSELIPGMKYRITDYACTTTLSDTLSAGHTFDIIVTAVSKNVLEHNASAVLHEGDTYFSNNNLAAWKIWYDIENDIHRYSWADVTNGKGVIYKMIDEFENECPYDFKNIQFKRYYINEIEIDSKIININWYVQGYYAWNTSKDINTSCKYKTLAETNYKWCYTFSFVDAEFVDGITNISYNSIQDATVNIIYETYNCAYNKLNPYIQNLAYGNAIESYTPYILNNVVIYNYQESGACYNNLQNMSNTTIGLMFVFNNFGKLCGNNLFLDGQMFHIIGDYFMQNIIGERCQINLFGNMCTNNTLCTLNHNNFFGSRCENNFLLYTCINNNFGNNNVDNILYNNCEDNIFNNNCLSIILEQSTTNCVIGNNVKDINCEGNNIKILDGVHGTSSSNKLSINSDTSYVQTVGQTPDGEIVAWNEALFAKALLLNSLT